MKHVLTAATVDADGNATTDQFYVPGATVEYTITVSYTGSNTANAGAIVMTDPIPAGTTFVAGSITYIEASTTVEGVNSVENLTDLDTDADEGSFGSNTVTVDFDGTRNGDDVNPDVITFRVTIDE